ncbi:MAG: hypothetical protein Q4D96_10775 [Propionibacteriaceae bacterium]|nr:hypothetical protein [Propionibacteriaceae bacterium]
MENGNVKEVHGKVSSRVDEVGSACIGKSAKIGSRLNALYNRVLTRNMTGAETQIDNAVSAGRNILGVHRQANAEMESNVQRFEREASELDEFEIADGKHV